MAITSIRQWEFEGDLYIDHLGSIPLRTNYSKHHREIETGQDLVASLRAGDYVWPGALGQGATNSDKEALFVMDDRDNFEFDYYPYIGDTLRQGLGLEVEAR